MYPAPNYNMPYKDKEKQKAWHRDNYKNNKKILDDMKSAPCMDCGNSFPPYVMEFDHVPERGKKLHNIMHLINGSIIRTNLQEELKKCDLVCSNCHKVRTYKRGQFCTRRTNIS